MIDTTLNKDSAFVKPPLWFAWILLSLVGLAVYANGISGQFVWDDYELIVDNPYIKSWRGLPHLFTEDIAAGAGEQFHYYRPLQMVTYWLNYATGGLNPSVFRMTNVVLHIFVSWVLFVFLRLISKDAWVAFIGALLFVLHPVHVGAITYISGRADSMSALFILISLIGFLSDRDDPVRWGKISLAYLSFVLALLTRENAMMMPIYLGLCSWVLRRRISLSHWMGILAVIGIYIAVRRLLFPQLVLPVSIVDWLPRLPGFFVAVSHYIQLLLIPHPLRVDYGVVYFSMLSVRALTGLVLWCATWIAAWGLRRRFPVYALGMLWFAAGLLPVSNIYPLNSYMAEHWLYLPSMGFLVCISLLIVNFVRKGTGTALILGVAILIILSWSGKTIAQNRIWREPIGFYRYMIKYAPDSVMLHNRMGLEYLRLGRMEEAERVFTWTHNLDTSYSPVLHNLGYICEYRGNYRQAIHYYQHALNLNPSQEKTWYNVARLQLENGSVSNALNSINQALAINPFYIPSIVVKAKALILIKQTDKAVPLLESVISVDSSYYEAYRILADAYHELDQYEKTMEISYDLLQHSPDDVVAITRIGNGLLSKGDILGALQWFGHAIEKHPQYAPFYNNLGIIYCRQGNYDKGVEMFKQALIVNPALDEARNNLTLIESIK